MRSKDQERLRALLRPESSFESLFALGADPTEAEGVSAFDLLQGLQDFAVEFCLQLQRQPGVLLQLVGAEGFRLLQFLAVKQDGAEGVIEPEKTVVDVRFRS